MINIDMYVYIYMLLLHSGIYKSDLVVCVRTISIHRCETCTCGLLFFFWFVDVFQSPYCTVVAI